MQYFKFYIILYCVIILLYYIFKRIHVLCYINEFGLFTYTLINSLKKIRVNDVIQSDSPFRLTLDYLGYICRHVVTKRKRSNCMLECVCGFYRLKKARGSDQDYTEQNTISTKKIKHKESVCLYQMTNTIINYTG